MSESPATPAERAANAEEERRHDIALIANIYQRQTPGLSRAEAMRLAEQHIPHHH